MIIVSISYSVSENIFIERRLRALNEAGVMYLWLGLHGKCHVYVASKYKVSVMNFKFHG